MTAFAERSVDRNDDWRKTYLMLASKKVRKTAEGGDRTEAQRKFNPDLKDSIQAVDMSRIGIRQRMTTDKGFVPRSTKERAPIVPASLILKMDQEGTGFQWANEFKWTRGRKGGPPIFDDRVPLRLWEGEIPTEYGKDSKPVRSFEIAKGAAGKLTPSGTKHTFIGNDPGKSVLNAGDAFVKGEGGSIFFPLKARGPENEAATNLRVVKRFRPFSLAYKLVKLFTGECWYPNLPTSQIEL
jgi:hypothetical protein